MFQFLCACDVGMGSIALTTNLSGIIYHKLQLETFKTSTAFFFLNFGNVCVCVYFHDCFFLILGMCVCVLLSRGDVGMGYIAFFQELKLLFKTSTTVFCSYWERECVVKS